MNIIFVNHFEYFMYINIFFFQNFFFSYYMLIKINIEKYFFFSYLIKYNFKHIFIIYN